MFGREAGYPSEIPKDYEVRGMTITSWFLPLLVIHDLYLIIHYYFFQITESRVDSVVMNEYVFEGLQDLEKTYTHVKKNVKQAQEKVANRKEKTGQNDNFEIGHRVILKNKMKEQHKGPKRAVDMLGPYVITELHGKCATLKNVGGKL